MCEEVPETLTTFEMLSVKETDDRPHQTILNVQITSVRSRYTTSPASFIDLFVLDVIQVLIKFQTFSEEDIWHLVTI